MVPFASKENLRSWIKAASHTTWVAAKLFRSAVADSLKTNRFAMDLIMVILSMKQRLLNCHLRNKNLRNQYPIISLVKGLGNKKYFLGSSVW